MPKPNYNLGPAPRVDDQFSPSRIADELAAQEYRIGSWDANYFDIEGEATPFAPRMERGLLEAVGLRWQRGSGELGDAWYLKTGTQGLVNLADRVYNFVGNVSDGHVHTANGPIPLMEATAEDVWDTIDEGTKSIYAQHGLTKERIIRQTGNDPLKLNKLHQEFVERQRVDAMLTQYAEEHGKAYFVAGGVAALGDIITDPANLFSFGTAGVVAASGKAVGRVVASRVGRKIAQVAGKSRTASIIADNTARRFTRMAARFKEGRMIEGLIEAGVPVQDAWAKRVFVAATTGSNMAQDLVMQVAEHDTDIRFGLVEEEADFRVSMARTGLTGLFSLALSSAIARVAMGKPIHATASEYMIHNRGSKVADDLRTLIRDGRINPDDTLDLDLVSDLEKMHQVMAASWGEGNYSGAIERIRKSVWGRETSGLRLIANYMTRLPNFDEFTKFMDDFTENLSLSEFYELVDGRVEGMFSRLPETEWSIAKKAMMDAQADVNIAYKGGVKMFSGKLDPVFAKAKRAVVRSRSGEEYEMEVLGVTAKQRMRKGKPWTQYTITGRKADGTEVSVKGGNIGEIYDADGTMYRRGNGDLVEFTQAEQFREAQFRLNKASSDLRAAKAKLDINNQTNLKSKKIKDPAVKEWFDNAQTTPTTNLSDDKVSRQNRAKHVISRHLVEGDTLGARPVGMLLSGIRALTFGMPTNRVNRIAKKLQKDGQLSAFDHLYLTLRSMLDDNGLDSFVTRPDGTAVPTAYMRAKQIQGMRTRLMSVIEQHMGEMKSSNIQHHEEVGSRVLQAVDQGLSLDNPAEQAIVTAVRKYMDDMGQRAAKSGVLPNLIENYLPVRLKRVMTSEEITTIADIIVGRWMDRFDPKKLNTAPHRGTLEDIGVTVKGELSDSAKANYENPPVLLAELTGEDYKKYVNRLKTVLTSEAETALRRKNGGAAETINDVMEGNLDTRAYQDAASMRRIEQSVWYSDEVLSMGLVDTNIIHMSYDYERTVGYWTALQETMQETFGEPLHWQDAMAYLKQLAGDDPESRKLVNELERREKIAGNRLRPAEQNQFLDFVNSFTRMITFGAVPVTIVGTEGSVGLARILGRGNIRQMAQYMKILLSRVDRDMLRRFGAASDLEYDDSRILGAAMVDAMDTNYSQSALVRGMRRLEDATRKFGLEMTMTRRLKTLHFYMSSGILDDYRGNLGKLKALDQRFDRTSAEGEKAFRAAARQAGVRLDQAQKLVESGVVSGRNLDAAEAFTKLDKNILTRVPDMEARLKELPAELQQAGRELIDSLTDFGIKDAEAFVTTVSPNSIMRSDHAIANAFLMYTSFPAAFAQRTLTRALAGAGVGNWKGYAYLGVYLFGEMFSNALRRILYNGDDPQTIFDEWEEDPVNMAAASLLRVPLFGPWNIAPEIAMSAFTDVPGYSMGGSAALSRGVYAMQNFVNLANSLADGEPGVDSTSLRKFVNTIPGANWWWLRIPFVRPDQDDRPDQVQILMEDYGTEKVPSVFDSLDMPGEPGTLPIGDTPYPVDINYDIDLDDVEIGQSGGVGGLPGAVMSATFGSIPFPSNVLGNTQSATSDLFDLSDGDTGDDPGSVDTMG